VLFVWLKNSSQVFPLFPQAVPHSYHHGIGRGGNISVVERLSRAEALLLSFFVVIDERKGGELDGGVRAVADICSLRLALSVVLRSCL
jgi:hypothetical protein